LAHEFLAPAGAAAAMTAEPAGGWLVLRHWSKGRRGGPWSPDDYDVMWKGCDIGRIFKPRAGAPPERPWEWTVAYGGGRASYGFAETREQAKKAFAESWRQYLETPEGARDAAWLLARSADSDEPKG
jgi:hypothetical protein